MVALPSLHEDCRTQRANQPQWNFMNKINWIISHVKILASISLHHKEASLTPNFFSTQITMFNHSPTWQTQCLLKVGQIALEIIELKCHLNSGLCLFWLDGLKRSWLEVLGLAFPWFLLMCHGSLEEVLGKPCRPHGILSHKSHPCLRTGILSAYFGFVIWDDCICYPNVLPLRHS
jgi:hypothetical protein